MSGDTGIIAQIQALFKLAHGAPIKKFGDQSSGVEHTVILSRRPVLLFRLVVA